MKIRIKFSKQGAMKFIGHLDTMRYFQKVMRRAESLISSMKRPISSVSSGRRVAAKAKNSERFIAGSL